jgi:ribose transport system ATP-binding protein
MSATTTLPALEIHAATKVFGGQVALDDVSLELREGEVHALLGHNGSGKSTLIKLLAGFHSPDGEGWAAVRGERFELGDPAAAHRAGLRFIHQDLALIGDLDAVDNLALGESYASKGFISDRRERANARRVFAEYGVAVDLDVPIRRLNRAQQAMIAIVRALHHQAARDGILVLDEPTAAFSASDTELLFDLIARVRAAGGTVLYVTHRLSEVFTIADRVTILRNGRKVATRQVVELDHDALVDLIIGRSLETFYPDHARGTGETLLELEELEGPNVDGVSLDVRAGEIVGLTGPKGSGADDLLHIAFGSRERSGGTVRARGRVVGDSPSDAVGAGIAFAPADRKEAAGILTWTLRENLTLPRLEVSRMLRWLSPRREAKDADRWLSQVGVVPANPEALYSTLSGGNQQKVVIARWLRAGARVYLLEEPTGGVDVGARQTIYSELRNLAAAGAAVLMSSSDTEEVCAVCDRVLVIRDGRVVASLAGASNTVDNVVRETIHEEGP